MRVICTETEKAKTFRIAVFIEQKLSGGEKVGNSNFRNKNVRKSQFCTKKDGSIQGLVVFLFGNQPPNFLTACFNSLLNKTDAFFVFMIFKQQLSDCSDIF